MRIQPGESSSGPVALKAANRQTGHPLSIPSGSSPKPEVAQFPVKVLKLYRKPSRVTADGLSQTVDLAVAMGRPGRVTRDSDKATAESLKRISPEKRARVLKTTERV